MSDTYICDRCGPRPGPNPTDVYGPFSLVLDGEGKSLCAPCAKEMNYLITAWWLRPRQDLQVGVCGEHAGSYKASLYRYGLFSWRQDRATGMIDVDGSPPIRDIPAPVAPRPLFPEAP